MTESANLPAARSTFLFVGVTTGQSAIQRVFPAWMNNLGLECSLVGIDCRIHDESAAYRRIVSRVAGEDGVIGALVTTHKIDLLAAARDLFDELDPFAKLLGEVSCISKRGRRLRGTALDPISSGLALESFLEPGHFGRTGAEVCILGAGGSALALTAYLMTRRPAEDRPARITITNRSRPRLQSMARIHRGLATGTEVRYVHAPQAAANDPPVSSLPPGSLVVNATGLGKDAPGSPITAAARFPERGLAWDFNYRGELAFLRQAEAQRGQRGLTVEDGWVYFVHGWTRALAEVFRLDLPTAGPEFDRLAAIAGSARADDAHFRREPREERT